MIEVGLPYITSGEEQSRIQALLTTDGVEFLLWFEVDREHEQFLCADRSDAFLVLLLYYALVNGHDLRFEGRISDQLYYNVVYYVVDALCMKDSSMSRIDIACETTSVVVEGLQGAATGYSGGIDSLATIKLHTDSDCPEPYRLRYLTFFNSGSASNADGTRAVTRSGDDLFLGRAKFARAFSRASGIPLIIVDSNLNDYLKTDFSLTHSYRNCGTALLLQKAFSAYYYSSAGFGLTRFSVNPRNDCSHYDDFLLRFFDNGNVTFYSALTSYSRFRKTEVVSEFPLAREFLNVCVREVSNCGRCKKCLRTLIALDLLDKLDSFDRVFDVDDYRANRAQALGKLIAYRHDEFFDDLFVRYRAKHGAFPPRAHAFAVASIVEGCFRGAGRRVKLALHTR